MSADILKGPLEVRVEFVTGDGRVIDLSGAASVAEVSLVMDHRSVMSQTTMSMNNPRVLMASTGVFAGTFGSEQAGWSIKIAGTGDLIQRERMVGEEVLRMYRVAENGGWEEVEL